jgi:hypothetical protein
MKKCSLRTALVCGMALLQLQCSDGGVGYDPKNGDPTGGIPPVQKPAVCKLAFDQTCWKSTIEKITSCLKADKGFDKFSPSHQVCGNESGKLVLFSDPVNLFSHPLDALHTMIQFKVIPDQMDAMKECFEVKGTMSNLEFKILKTGETARIAIDSQKMSFTCIDGQQVHIPRQNIDECHQVHGKGSDVVPGVDAGPFYNAGGEQGWFFKIKGAGLKREIFRCHH